MPSPESLYGEISLHQDRGELQDAFRLADEAYRRYAPTNPPWGWRFLVLKAHAAYSLGHYRDALQLLSAPPPLSLATSEDAVQQKAVLGYAHIALSQFSEAQKALDEAEAVAAQYQPQTQVDVELGRYLMRLSQNDLTGAQVIARHSLDLAIQYHRRFREAYIRNALGLIAMLSERYDEATDWFKEALAVAEPLRARGTIERVHGNLGWCYFKLGDFERSLDYSQKAAVEAAELGQLDQVKWVMNIGTANMNMSELSLADQNYQSALSLARSVHDQTSEIQCLINLAFVALRRGDPGAAQTWNEQALRLEQETSNHSEALFSSVVAGRIAAARGNFAGGESLIRRAIAETPVGTSLNLYAHEKLARLYADANRPADAEREFRHALHLVEAGRSSLVQEELRLSFFVTEAGLYSDFVAFLEQHGRPREALQVAEISRARTLAEGLGVQPKNISFPIPNFHPEGAAQRLHATILFYSLLEKQSYLWVITPAKTTCLTLPATNEIDALVKSYREAVLSGRDILETGNVEGNKLYALLIEPAKKWIPPNSRVILLPDGSLYGFNFETLIAPEPKPHFWIEDVTLSTASSLTLLSAGAAKPANTVPGVPAVSRRAQGTDISADRLLLVGNAVSSSPDFPPLRQAASEIDHISHYFPDGRRDVLAGSQATPAAFLQHGPESFGYLHFVTHGIASRTHPLDSAVILSPDPGDAASFKLYAREIVKHRLSAYLVTISACNGSGTRAFSGEGLVGLSWAFLRAGAHNVIAALWEVNDASTPQLMDAMYAELARGQAPADALRAAKLSLLQTDSVFRKPFYWAPFQLYSGS